MRYFARRTGTPLRSALAPKPDSQSGQNDKGYDAHPEGDVDISRSYLDPEENSKQLRKGNEPEEDRRQKRCWPFHLNTR